jgi:ABC-type multidrug transport system fused ATPase/permease subunit
MGLLRDHRLIVPSDSTDTLRGDAVESQQEGVRPESRNGSVEKPSKDKPEDDLGESDGETEISTWYCIRRLSPFVLPYWTRIAAALVLMLAEAGMNLLKPWPLKLTLDSIIRQPDLGGTTFYVLLGICALVIGLSVFEGLLGYLTALCLNRAGRLAVFNLRTAVFDHVQRLSLQFHYRKSTGDLMARVTNDVKAIKDAMTDSVIDIIKSILFLVGMSTVLVCLDWPLAMVLMCAAPVMFLVLRSYLRTLKKRARKARKREGRLASALHESLGTVRLIRAYNQEEEARKRFHAKSAASLESDLAASMAGERFSWTLDVIGGVVTALMLGLGTERVMAQAITPGSLIVFVSYVRNLYKALRTAAKQVAKVTRASAGMERVVELLDLQAMVVDRPDAREAPPFQGQIEFRNVSFEYQAGQPALHDINLTIPARRVTAIVGPTGSGKTTLVSLIPRLFDPTQGAVLIDGENIQEWTLRSMRSQISMVLQESVLLQATIAENIAYARPDAGIDEIVAAARDANAHDFIKEMPDGYNTVLGERGETLSGGQRQRIAIARAIIRDAPIVILDEPLTGLDATAAAAVMDALKQLMKDKTVVIITHHLNLMQHAHQVIVLADGQVVQQGTQQKLLELDGLYRQLFHAQFSEVMTAEQD